MVAHIDYTDTLRKGTDKLNAVIDQSNEAIGKADATEAIAIEALTISEDTQTQLDTIVINGDSSVEAAQARVSTPKGQTFTVLKERLDAGEQDLAAHVADIAKINKIDEVLEKMRSLVATKIVCFGDSITYGFNHSTLGQVTNTYPKILQEYLRSYYKGDHITVVNRGENGNTSSDILLRLPTIITDNPNLVILMVGSNDPFAGVSLKTYKSDLTSIIKQLKENNIAVILMSPMVSLSSWRYQITLYAQAMKELAVKNDVDFIDMQKKTSEVILESGAFVPRLTIPDLTHPDPDRYYIIADIVMERLMGRTYDDILNVSAPLTIPAVNSPHIRTNMTVANTYVDPAGGFYGNIYIIDQASTSYIELSFYVSEPNLDLYWICPSDPSIGSIQIRDKDVMQPGIFKLTNVENSMVDQEIRIVKNLSVGYHSIHFGSTQFSSGNRAFISGFSFKPTRELLNRTYKNLTTDSAGALEAFKTITRKTKFTTTAQSKQGAIIYDSEKLELVASKLLVLEFEFVATSNTAITWFGKPARGSNAALTDNFGYAVLFLSNDLVIGKANVNNQFATLTSASAGTINYAISHTLRIEHTYSGTIYVYLDNVLITSYSSDTTQIDGWIGVYHHGVATTNITRAEYCYKDA